MKNFPIMRLGNKQNDIKYFKHLLPLDNIDVVCEAFAGTVAVIRNCYPNTKKYICSDNDDNFLNRVKNIFNNLEEFYKERDNINKYIKENTPNNKKIKKYLIEYLKDNKYFYYPDITVRGMLRPLPSLKYDELKPVIDKIEWYDDYKKVLDIAINEPSYFVFLDPPYFLSNNKDYTGMKYEDNGDIRDNTFFYIDILNFFNICKCKCMMIINKSAILYHLFKDFYKGEYKKTYSITQKHDILMILTNY